MTTGWGQTIELENNDDGTWNVIYASPNDIINFQFDVDGDGVTVDNAYGGAAEAAGFMVTASSTTVIGFSLTQATIPFAIGGTLVVLELSGEPTGLSNMVFSDSDGNAMAFTFIWEGCPDDSACNYDENATIDNGNGSCLYADEDLCGVCDGDNSSCTGCTDPEACNYDPNATDDDGSCEYEIDCAGECGGDAVYDVCEECGGIETDIDNCTCLGENIIYDCNGDCPPIEGCLDEFSFTEGCAQIDECNICVGGATERYPCEQDCSGTWGGSAYEDNCDICIVDINDIDCFNASFKIYNSNGLEEDDFIIKELDTIYVALHMQNLPDSLEGIIFHIDYDSNDLSLIDSKLNPGEFDTGLTIPYLLDSSYVLYQDSNNGEFSAAIVLTTNVTYQGNDGNILFLQFSNLGINGDSTVISYNTVQVNEHVMQEQNYTSQVIYFGDCYGVFNGETPLDECGVCGGDNSSCSGCTDPEACNYDETATADDGSCEYEYDCAGECGGELEPDCCGVCGGDNSQCSSCCGSPLYEDCTDDCVIDDLDQCCIPQDVDVCGVCFGDGSSCVEEYGCAHLSDGMAENPMDCETVPWFNPSQFGELLDMYRLFNVVFSCWGVQNVDLLYYSVSAGHWIGAFNPETDQIMGAYEIVAYNNGQYAPTADIFIYGDPVEDIGLIPIFKLYNNFDKTIHNLYPNFCNDNVSCQYDCSEDAILPIEGQCIDMFINECYQNPLVDEGYCQGYSSIQNCGLITCNGECNEECISGDVNCDGELNVLDVVLMVNMILTDEYDEIADVNADGVLNVLDVVILVNLILDGDAGACIDIDGNTYETVQIGEQLWMAENLKVTHYNNGDEISYPSNEDFGSYDEGQYGVYDNDPANADVYGNLYNWAVVDDDRGVCPEGYHIPSDEEFMELEMYLGMSESEANDAGFRGTNEGSKLAGNSDLWDYDNLVSNPEFGTSGFNGLPAGCRSNGDGNYYGMGQGGFFWSSSEIGSNSTYFRILLYYNYSVYRDYEYNQLGFSIRCLGD